MCHQPVNADSPGLPAPEASNPDPGMSLAAAKVVVDFRPDTLSALSPNPNPAVNHSGVYIPPEIFRRTATG